eukprot:TRINITY_DN8628_c1_g1_i1.p1 TRINITY_DN8628_c1_g1~~TRINITY_DN8628_c1_g1_i1.p1  ORF type:complete len:438 (+),score=146.68 TRINITY_DN8628_c1_g1_i1:86-1399(+)
MVTADDGRSEASAHSVHLACGAVGLLLFTLQDDGGSEGFRAAAALWVGGYVLFSLGAAWAMGREGSAERREEARRRLNTALTLPGCDITEEWYEAAGRWVWAVGAGAAALFFAGLAALCAAAYPAAGLPWAGDRLQGLWEHLLDNYSHEQIFVGGYLICHFGVFWVLSAANAVLDLWRPAALEPFRVHPEHQVTVRAMCRAAGVALFNQFLTLLPHLYGTALITGWVPQMFARQLPSLAHLVVSQVAFMCISEPFFYFTHKLLHTPLGYKYVHALHHSITKPSSVWAIYAHPVEHLCSVTPFFLAGPLLLRSHVTLWMVWYANRTLQSCTAHCSLSLPWIGSNMFHAYHHVEVAGPEGYQNLGFNTGILDALCGTTAYYRRHTWQARIDCKYTDQTMPVDRLLAMHGLLPDAAGLSQGPSEPCVEVDAKTAAPPPEV